MRKTLPLLIIACFSSLASCSPSRQSDPESAASPIPSSIQYEGESTMRVYQVTIDWTTKKPVSARFDMEFKAKNGEPIADSDKYGELFETIDPVMGRGGYYSMHGFYYDLDCTKRIQFDDVATHDINIFYYLTGGQVEPPEI